jgi:hypothetical protein
VVAQAAVSMIVQYPLSGRDARSPPVPAYRQCPLVAGRISG